MANIFQAQALVTNGVSVGGLASIGYQANYQDTIASSNDGAVGAEMSDRGGLQIRTRLECTDITKVNAILDAAVGDTLFSGREMGATTYRDMTLKNTLWNSMNIRVGKSADGTLQLGGGMRFIAAATKLADMVLHTAAQPAPTQTVPTRLYRANTLSFDADPAGAPFIAPIDISSLSLSLSRPLVSGYGDTDIGETSLDVGEWGLLQFGCSISDTTVVGTSDIAASLVDAGRGTLTVKLSGRGGAADLTLTIENFLFGGGDGEFSPEIAQFPLRGFAGWRKYLAAGDVVYTMNGATKLFSIA